MQFSHPVDNSQHVNLNRADEFNREGSQIACHKYNVHKEEAKTKLLLGKTL